jgi:uncharacterized RDD family membrane protein YckC
MDHFLVSAAGPMAMGIILKVLLALGLYSMASLIMPNITGPTSAADLRALWNTFSALDRLIFVIKVLVFPRWIYMTLFHASPVQATPGKLVLGLKVVDANGSRIGYAAAALRSLIRGLLFVCTLGLSGVINVFFIAMRTKRQALHDLIVGSEVVRSSWLEANLKIHDTVSVTSR